MVLPMLAIGIVLLVVGFFIAAFTAFGVFGKKKVGASIALVVLFAGGVSAGMGGAFDNLLTAAPPGDAGPSYEVAWHDATPTDNSPPDDMTEIVSTDFKHYQIFANQTNLGTGDWAETDWTINYLVSRTDTGLSTEQQTIYMDLGTVDTITDVSAGVTYPIFDFNDATEAYDFTFADGGDSDANLAPGLISRNRYFVSISPGEVWNAHSVIDPNEAAFTAGVIGESYGFTVIIAGQVLSMELTITAA